MSRGPRVAVMGASIGLLCVTALGPTYLPTRTPDTRKVEVVREYDIPVTKGQKSVAAVPAMMSFWGATNQQAILESSFTYSVPPDKVTSATPPGGGPPVRVYELTWNAPQADTVKVRQRLLVEISCSNTLWTAAKLPYPKEVQAFFSGSLAKTDQINPENPKIEAAAKAILAKAKFAADAMDMAAGWVDENIKFKSRAAGKSDDIVADGAGNCVGMSKVACALLRKMGIPAETVSAKFIGGGGHEFIEAYLPDAGWIFFDPSNANHGFKCCDVLMTAGWGFMTLQGQNGQFHGGDFLTAKDVGKYEEPRLSQPALRPGPKDKSVTGVRIVYQAPPATVKARHLPLSMLIVDPTLEPGKTVYRKTPPPYAAKDSPASSPTSRAATGTATSRPGK